MHKTKMKASIGRLTILLTTGFMFAMPAVAEVDLGSAEGALEAFRKIQCSTVDGKPIYYWWKGRAYSRRMGEADKLLFNAEGMNVRQCGTVNDPDRGAGMRLVSREILMYTDPKTGQPLDEWENPWTGQTGCRVGLPQSPRIALR